MISRLWIAAALAPLLWGTTAQAQTVDSLKGKFTFNWHSDPARQRCVKIEDRLLAEFKSDKYKCELKPISNTASGASAQVCSEVKGKKSKKEYLIFATQRACDGERKVQASNS